MTSNKNHIGHETIPQIYRHETRSVHQHEQGYPGWDLRLLQVSEGQFEGEITTLDLEGLKIVKDHSNKAMLKQGELEETSISFSIPLSSPCAPLICQGKHYEQGGVLAVRGGELPEIRVNAGLDLLCLCVECSSFISLLNGPESDIDGLKTGPNYLPIHIGSQDLTQLFELTCHTLSSAPSHLSLHRELRDAFLSHVLDALEQGPVERISPSARKRVVDRARDVIAAHDGEPIAIPTLCHQIGVSRRKLQYCFQDCLGISPGVYIRLFRLNAIHRTLSYGNDSMRVQDEAVRWGFFHLGHFCSDYRRLFGERPSDTLNRARQYPAKSG